MNGTYDEAKLEVEQFIVNKLDDLLPGFQKEDIELVHTATPVTWQNWVYRKKRQSRWYTSKYGTFVA